MRPPRRTPPGRGLTSGLTPVIGRQHLDDLVDDYVSWREACAIVCAAYEKWTRAAPEDQRLAFSEYVAALNCEEQAAAVYQQAVERLTAMTPA